MENLCKCNFRYDGLAGPKHIVIKLGCNLHQFMCAQGKFRRVRKISKKKDC
jgi:hypothetical protein